MSIEKYKIFCGIIPAMENTHFKIYANEFSDKAEPIVTITDPNRELALAAFKSMQGNVKVAGPDGIHIPPTALIFVERNDRTIPLSWVEADRWVAPTEQAVEVEVIVKKKSEEDKKEAPAASPSSAKKKE